LLQAKNVKWFVWCRLIWANLAEH